jgi:putative alpha-1,2-mannosidase
MTLKKAIIRLTNGKSFTILAKNLSDQNIYIRSVRLNGKQYQKSYLRHEDMVNGGELVFEMGSAPNKEWASAPEAAPYSISR